ncbi:MAG: Trp family transcriptional regulator [Fibrobacterota bacterium]
MTDLKDIAELFDRAERDEIASLLQELFTETELSKLTLRWELIRRLRRGETQRRIAADLGISLCKVTRGNKILKDKTSATNKLLERLYRNEES